MSEVLFVECEVCGGEGRRYAGHQNDPHPLDLGPCRVCQGRCIVEIEAEPAGIEFAAVSTEHMEQAVRRLG